MADKFTRLSAVEGDIWYATTASSSKSLETLEDNIDAKLMGFIGSDIVGGSIASSVTQTKIGEVVIAANSANTKIIIFAGVRFQDTTSNTSSNSVFRIRTGTSATATSNTLRQSITLNKVLGGGATIGGGGIIGGVLMWVLSNTDEVFTGQIYVHVTAQNANSDIDIIGTCDFIHVLGI